MSARTFRGRPPRAARASVRARARGMTLLEVIVAVSVLSMLGAIVYGAFSGLSGARAAVGRADEKYAQGRTALGRIARELQAAFVSAHQPFNAQLSVRNTAFVGVSGSPGDRLDFTSFSHRRLSRNSHESDQNELGYFASPDPNVRDKIDLVRRESPVIDLEPTRGGIVQVVAEDIQSFDLEYLDPLTNEWQETWDSTQAAAQFGRLPSQVRIRLALRRENADPYVFTTKVSLAMQNPLSFAVPR